MKSHSFAYNSLLVLLRCALVAAIVVACWSVYRYLPVDESSSGHRGGEQTEIEVLLRGEAGNPIEIAVEFFPLDVAAARREYVSDPRPGVRFEEFILHKMPPGRKRVETRLDQNGRATVSLAPGRWWLHAVQPGTDSLEWLMPVEVAGVRKTIELNGGNAEFKMRSY